MNVQNTKQPALAYSMCLRFMFVFKKSFKYIIFLYYTNNCFVLNLRLLFTTQNEKFHYSLLYYYHV